jgi:hypothetical protein
LREEAERFLRAVGRVVDVVVGEEYAVDWGSVSLPRGAGERERAMLLEHARMLLTYFPANPETVRVCHVIALSRGMDPEGFAAYASDAMAAHAHVAYAGSSDGETYVTALAAHIAPQHPPVPGRALVCLLGRTAGLRVMCTGEPAQVAERMGDILGRSLDVGRKLEMLADLLRPYFGSRRPGAVRPSAEGADPLDTSSALAELSPETLERAMASGYSKGPSDTVVFARNPVSAALKLRIHARVRGAGGGGRPADGWRFYDQWVPGDGPQALLVRDTIRVFGTVLPPVSSLKWGVYAGEAPGVGGSRVVVMDVSSSMAGATSYLARSVAASLVVQAEEGEEPVTVCYFNGSALVRRYGRDYGRALDDICSVVFTGGTAPEKALRACSRELGGTGTLDLVTDGRVDDRTAREEVLRLLAAASERVETTVHIVSADPGAAGWLHGGRWSVRLHQK